MNQDDSGSGTRSIIERISQALLGEPTDRDELLHVLREAQGRDLIGGDALAMIEGVLAVSELRVRDIMIPRSQMIVVEHDDPFDQIVRAAVESGHSRFPVIGDSRDEVEGILLAKDLLGCCLGEGAQFNLRDLMRPAVFIPDSKRLNVLLREFRASRNHVAIVVDEYGGVAGMVTIEDVLEQIVGEIEDEHDVAEEGTIRRINEGSYIVKAVTPVEDFNDYFGTQFDDEEFDTIAGLVLKSLGHMPRRGEVCLIDRLRFRVLRADSRRIHLLQLSVLPEPSATEETD